MAVLLRHVLALLLHHSLEVLLLDFLVGFFILCLISFVVRIFVVLAETTLTGAVLTDPKHPWYSPHRPCSSVFAPRS